jgi:SecD/SecF fusion protein
LGFSLYDTIIVFDRIRENVPRMPRATFSQIVNRSMSEVIVRSLVTSLSTLLPITALMLFGGETLRDFGFALLVGVASGTYSSIFIAAPVLVHWKEREQVWKRRERIVREDHGGVVPAYSEAALGDEAARRSVIRRERPARAARTADGATATAAPPATTEVVPPDDGGNGVPDESAAEAKARAERPKPKSSGNRKRRRHGR